MQVPIVLVGVFSREWIVAGIGIFSFVFYVSFLRVHVPEPFVEVGSEAVLVSLFGWRWRIPNEHSRSRPLRARVQLVLCFPLGRQLAADRDIIASASNPAFLEQTMLPEDGDG